MIEPVKRSHVILNGSLDWSLLDRFKFKIEEGWNDFVKTNYLNCDFRSLMDDTRAIFAGGFIRDTLLSRIPRDIDIWVEPDSTTWTAIRDHFISKSNYSDPDNAGYSRDSSLLSGQFCTKPEVVWPETIVKSIPFNVIVLRESRSIKEVMEFFDYRCCQIGYSKPTDKDRALYTVGDPNLVLDDIANMRLTPTGAGDEWRSEDQTKERLDKLIRRGWELVGDSATAIACRCDLNAILASGKTLQSGGKCPICGGI